MKLRSLLSEAGRNLVSGTSRTATFAVALSMLLALPVLADVFVTTSLVHAANEFRNSGASIITVSAPDGIDGAACEALAEVPQVRAAGALSITGERLTVATLPRSPLDLHRITDGFADVLSAHRQGSEGLVLTDAVMSAAGTRSDHLVTDLGAVSVDGAFTYPADGRRSGFGWAALATQPAAGTFDECWVEAWPTSEALRTILFTSVSASIPSDTKVTVAQLNGQHGNSFDGFSLYEDRITRFAPAVAWLLSVGLAIVAIRLRRLELAARLHDRMSRRSLYGLVLIEAVGWLVPGCVLALAAATVAISFGPSGAIPVFWTELGTVGCALLGGIAGTMLAVAMVRERNLFAHFKDR